MLNFEQVLNDIENLLFGKQLQPINPSTPPLCILSIERENGKYKVSSNSETKTRSLSELEAIFANLNIRGFCNVEQVLYGSSSSRNQPETIFANLPYIQHFKYEKKKHLLLRSHNVHDAATLSEVQGSEFRVLRKKIDNFLNLNLGKIYEQQVELVKSLDDAYQIVLKKFPSEIASKKVEVTLNSFKELSADMANSVVTLDYNIEVPTLKISNNTTVEELIESSKTYGVDDGENDTTSSQLNLELKTLQAKLGVARITSKTPVLSLIFDRVHFGDIELQPDFQRKDRIWNNEKKSKLIESILLKLPLPVFYFGDRITEDRWVVVDGLQRITTIYDFMSGEFKLSKLEILEDLNGKDFGELTRTEQRAIREYEITAYFIEMNKDSTDLIVELFHRINTYGVKLSDQEIRSALNQGSSVKFLRYLSSKKEFKKATHGKVKSDRQKDMELCLSALAFIILGFKNYNFNSYDKFLSKAMENLNLYKLNLINEKEVDLGNAYISNECIEYLQIERKYLRALNLAYKVFGDLAFIKEIGSNTSPISKQLYEVIIYYFYHLTDEQENSLLKQSDKLVDALYSAIESNSKDYATWDSQTYIEAERGFKDSISTSTGKKITILYRFNSFAKILEDSTDIKVISTNEDYV
ncbi:hypothetical protein L420_01697 [Enterobacter hormaechei subsp. hoffmannii UCICRE 9]|uniref:DUF262 domain-containing protein n=1 Tax=Enterobacter hormaechei TaxID=158836 RepID=UPI0003BF1D6C|nr:DUF262 domain-containing protein [Enterobacter hormaechei]EBN3334017.1 DUF262 domain-containing protein [Salmonella enterica]EDZ7781036.1 DUF262 domain-containing protein [Salmonella enterica]EFS1132593.1 DUF262 domain-containing protein [Salmonella enterica]EGO0968120.1 DUF262 domain-containing protein [Salmonella enterica]EGW0538593.1 DUF262 domain-containing protein [Salmonella enterica]